MMVHTTHAASLHNPILEQLAFIKEKRFTNREIDIIACLLCGRSRAISSFLSIAPKTVETHVRNIMLKIECNSREGIIDFIEKSDKFLLIRAYYQTLAITQTFEKILKEKLPFIKRQATICKISFDTSLFDKERVFINHLNKHLNLLNISTTISACENHSMNEHIEIAKTDKKNDNLSMIHIFASNSNLPVTNHTSIFSLLIGKSEGIAAQQNEIHWDIGESYYFNFFYLLQKLFPSHSIDEVISDFKIYYAQLNALDFANQSFISNQQQQKVPYTAPFRQRLICLLKKRPILFTGIVFLVIILFTSLLLVSIKYTTKSNKPIVRSELLIPKDALFLKRPHVVNKMDELLKNVKQIDSIASIAVIGMGGAGKTTLARYYASLHDAPIIWEINAETRKSLINSFNDLAFKLARTKEQREELLFIKSIQSIEEQEKNLMHFIKEQLQQMPGWLLIYDNVESFSEIKQFIPHDKNVWGAGKVIMTTRDNNLIHSSHVTDKNVIQIDQLNQEEALTLFCKIIYNKEPNSLTKEIREQTKDFIAHIPPFPLDISIAAYYIKNASLTFDTYLKRISYNAQTFNNEWQHTFSNEMTDYTKTRYGIITSSLIKLLDLNPEYKELLFLLCLFDSQNIPLTLLEFYKNPILIDSFLRDLKKYAFITTPNLAAGKKTERDVFSLHRSTQIISKEFLLNQLEKKEIKKLSNVYSVLIKDFYKAYIKGNNNNFTFLIPHFESLLTNINASLLVESDKEENIQNILYAISYTCYDSIRNYIQVEKYFKDLCDRQDKKQYLTNLEFATLLKDLADVSVELENTTAAVLYSDKSFKICEKISHSEILATEVLRIKGYAYTHQNNIENANYYFNLSLQKSSHISQEKKRDAEASIYTHMGMLYSLSYTQGEKADLGIQYLQKALKIINGDSYYHLNHATLPKGLSCIIVRYKANLARAYCRHGKYLAAELLLKDTQYIIDNSSDNCSHNFTKELIANSMGEIYLRSAKFKLAKEKLHDSIKNTEKLVGKNNRHVIIPRILYIEAQIQLGELKEAYENCISILQTEPKSHTNTLDLIFITAHYHAAVIKYRQNELKKSWDHFSDFITRIQAVCQRILTKNDFQNLQQRKVFDVPVYQDSMAFDIIKQCFQQSTAIFLALYGQDHPFIGNYVLVSYNKSQNEKLA